MPAHLPVPLAILAAACLVTIATSAIAQESTGLSTLPSVTVTGTQQDYRQTTTSSATRTDTPRTAPPDVTAMVTDMFKDFDPQVRAALKAAQGFKASDEKGVKQ